MSVNVAEVFGQDVFNEAVMKERLPEVTYKQMVKLMNEGGEVTLELADIVGIRPQSLGALLARLEADGCIERAAGEQDRRARQVKLTDHGRDQAQEARDHQRAFARDTLAVLDDAEKRQLAAIVLKLNAALG